MTARAFICFFEGQRGSLKYAQMQVDSKYLERNVPVRVMMNLSG